jgi:monoamine oxidase
VHADVVVAGAGMAGLTCALDLADAGADVVVLEAGGRPGGRVRTVTFPDGTWVETGGEWIDTAHSHVHALLGRFGLEVVGDAPPWWDREAGWVDDERGLRPASEAWLGDADVRADLGNYDLLLTVYAGGIADPARPEEHPDAAAIDARSARDLFEELGLGGFARFILTRAIEFEYTCAPHEISALFLAQQRAVEIAEERAFGDVRSQRVRGGLSQLAEAMAAELGGRVRYREPLVSLALRGGEIEAGTPSDVIDAERVVLAIPPPPLRRLAVEPPLDPRLAEAMASVDLGAVTKTFVRYPERSWPFVWANTTRFLQRVYDATEEQPGPSGVLDAYIGGDDARALDAAFPGGEERLAHVRDEIERMLPALAGTATGGLSRSWTSHPRYGGSFSVWRPGQVTRHWRVLREPHGSVHIAGEHAGTVCGYVEGAVQSGHRAAAEVLAAS